MLARRREPSTHRPDIRPQPTRRTQSHRATRLTTGRSPYTGSDYHAKRPTPLGHGRPPMSPSPSPPRRRRIRVVLSSTALQPFVSVQKAAALAIAQLGVGAFFVSGVCPSSLGVSAGWFVLAATVLCGFARAIDIESWALLDSRRLRRQGDDRVWSGGDRRRHGGRVRRAAAARRGRVCRHRPLRRERIGHRHRGMAVHRLRATRGLRHAARDLRRSPCCGSGRAPAGTSVATPPHERPGLASAP